MNNSRNLLLAVVLSLALVFGWGQLMGYLYPDAYAPVETTAEAPGGETTPANADGTGADGTATPSGAQADVGEEKRAATGPVDLKTALAKPNRVVIDAPRLAGSINLRGARIDDIVLKDHRETVDKDSGPVRLFAPPNTAEQYYAEFGFLAGGKRLSPDTLWQADAETLSVDSPVTLTHTDAAGVTYSVKLSIDANYMLTVEQGVTNSSDKAEIIQPFALIRRHAVAGVSTSADTWLSHAGPVGVFGGTLDDSVSYNCDGSFFLFPCTGLREKREVIPAGAADWLGFGDDYWFAALVPGESEIDLAGFRMAKGSSDVFQGDIRYDAVTVPENGSVSFSTRLFAGAKESAVLGEYEDSGITYFGKAVSWGWFEIIEKPLLWLLRTLNGLIGNFGVAIICLTLIIRGLMFPIAQRGFASMASMKAIQPKMKEIQERYKDDKQVQQQKIMELYKQEKVNPVAGCLPMLLQIPVFFALYKVLILSIEMRHEPFLYIRDLTAPDPATILNLFGYLPFEVPGFLGIGVLAVLLGITMWLTFKLNPSAMDPTQQQIFNLMPWFLMFVMAPFAAGLLLYWVTSNILTLAQQKYLYSKHPQLKAAAEKEKAEMAQKAEREKAEKSGA